MNNDFHISNVIIPNENALERLIVPSAQTSNISTIDYDITQQIDFIELFDTHIIRLSNLPLVTGTISLPSNSDLKLLFKSPQNGSILSWLIETDNQVNITYDDDGGFPPSIGPGTYWLFIQITDTDTPTFKVHFVYIGGSVTLSSRVVTVDNTNAFTLTGTQVFPPGETTVQNVTIIPGLSNPTGVVTMTLDTLNNYLLGITNMSQAMTAEMTVTNTCGQNITTINAGGATNLTGVGVINDNKSVRLTFTFYNISSGKPQNFDLHIEALS